jgi:hypothetical protein
MSSGSGDPAPNEHLRGLGRVNADLIAAVQKCTPHKHATLDQDATLVETSKAQSLFCYKSFRAYQPLNTYWAEQGLVLHSEFRDGNVPAGFEQVRVLEEALALLPAGVEKVFVRSDSAGYQTDLLTYCAEGRNERFLVIEFAVSVDITREFRAAALASDVQWQPLGNDQEHAEVAFVPSWIAHARKGAPEYRFLDQTARPAASQYTYTILHRCNVRMKCMTIPWRQRALGRRHEA